MINKEFYDPEKKPPRGRRAKPPRIENRSTPVLQPVTSLDQHHSRAGSDQVAARTSQVDRAEVPIDTIESSIRDGASGPSEDGYEDPLTTFYNQVGYLPPLDDATLDLLDAILPNLGLVARMPLVSASKHTDIFKKGLEYRNVDQRPSRASDSLCEEIKCLVLPEWLKEDPVEKTYKNYLWELDREKASNEGDEATFQRTVLTSMIDRYRFMYGNGLTGKAMLDFAFESSWNCTPMPTRAFLRREMFLTQPKPDLAVAFRRESLFPEGLDWNLFPAATQSLVCFEKTVIPQSGRAFHFLAIEAKNADTNVHSEVALLQGLNSASQALHNMYEFFREADEEGENEFVNIFFDRVRFFSVVAIADTIQIRIHRACRVSSSMNPADRDYEPQRFTNPIYDDYPLRFAYDNYWKGDSENRQDVMDQLAHILYGYGAGELAGHLQSAIRKVAQKLKDHKEKWDSELPRDHKYYSHGQMRLPAESVARSRTASTCTQRGLASQRSSVAPSLNYIHSAQASFEFTRASPAVSQQEASPRARKNKRRKH